MSATIAMSAGCGDERVQAVVVELRLAPAAMDYGALPVGARVVRTATIVNDGNGPYAPSSPPVIEGADGAYTFLSQCALPLPPGAFCEMDIAFAPKVEGPLSARLVVEPPPGAAPDAVLAIDLAGVGSPAEVIVSPDALDFGALPVGATLRRSFTVESRAGAALELPLAIDGEGFRIVAIDGDATLVDGPTATTLHIEPDSTLTVDVDFAPQRGGPFTATALVEICGARCGPAVSLTGAGEAPRIDVQPRTLDIGEVAVSSTATAALTVSNVGAGDLVLLRLDLLSPTDELALDDASVDALPITIAAGASTSVTLRYAPSVARGALDATLRIRSNDPVSSDVLVPVTATAPGPSLELLPHVASFGVLDEGNERTLDVVVRSIGTVPAVVQRVDVTGASFAFDGASPPTGQLLPGEALLFRVRATASAAAVAAGGATGSVVVTGAGLDDLTLPLSFFSGTVGCQPRAPLANTSLGAVVLGQGTSGIITLQNVGDGACRLESATAPPGLPSDVAFQFSTARAVDIAPGGVAEVDVSFDALDPGQVSAFLSLVYATNPLGVDDAPPATLLVSATARAVTGTVVGEPPLLEIGPIIEGCPAEDRIGTFVNRGPLTASLDEIRIASLGAPGALVPFSFDPANLPVALTPGGALGVRVHIAQGAPPGVYQAELQAVVEGQVDATVRLRLTVQPADAPITESFEAADLRAVDVLFVVDNSGSMADDQQLLANNFNRFIESAFDDTSLRFHIGVTTTDVIGGTGGPLVASYLTDSLSQSTLESSFGAMALVGTEGNGIELGLEAMRRAVDDLANTTNAGFLRDSAALSIVIVSDEEDNGGDPTLDPSVVREVETYIEVLSALKNNIQNTPVLVSVVVTQGFATRYETVAAAFGGVVLDIASPVWGDELSEVGAATFGLQRLFRLGSTPDAGSVVVLVDGVATTAFTVQDNAVVLDNAPDAGDVIDITYVAGCTP